MQLVAERQIGGDQSLPGLIAAATTTATPPKPVPRETAEFVHRAAWKAGVLGSLNVLIAVIAARFILMLAIVGAVALAWVGISNPDPWRVSILAAYAILVVIPMVWLASRG